MQIKDILYKTPEMTEDKFIESVNEVIAGPVISNFKVLKYKKWSAEELIKEWDLICVKKSNLSRSQREAINLIIAYALHKMVE